MAKAQKGSVFERSFCRTLTTWWREGKDPEGDVLFWRTSQSGGRVTSRFKKGKGSTAAHCGDITAIDPEGEPLTKYLTFELKRGYPKVSIADVLDKSKALKQREFEAWVQQARVAAEHAGTFSWVLVHHRSGNRVPIVYFPHALMLELVGAECFPKPPAPFMTFDAFFKTRTEGPKVVETKERLLLCATTLDKFLKHVQPSDIRTLSKRYLKRKRSEGEK